MLQGGAASLAVFLETAPPPLYLVYMLAAGFGLPVSTTEPTDTQPCVFVMLLSLSLLCLVLCPSLRAGLSCLQCSEDALVVWAGSNIFRGVYGGLGF